MNELAQLHADLLAAASQGAERAGTEAVIAGADHTDSAGHALLAVESVTTQFSGPMHASVIASQPAGINAQGPSLPDTERTADIMAEAAVDAAIDALRGK